MTPPPHVVLPLPPGYQGGVDVVALGEPLVAFLAADGLPLPAATTYRRTVVGAEFNVAVGVARLGHHAALIGRIGDDPFGQLIRSMLRAERVDDLLTVDPTAATGMLVRDVTVSRPITVQYARNGSAGSRLIPADIDPATITGSRILHVSGITPMLSDNAAEATQYAIDAAHNAGTLICFDPNVRHRLIRTNSRALLRELGGRADLVIAGRDELAWLTNTEDEAIGAAQLIAAGATAVVVKDGARGARAYDRAAHSVVPAVPISVIDPVGAGDAFVAGLLSALLRGINGPQCLDEAAAVAAFVVATPGDTEGLPTASLRDSDTDRDGQVER